MFLHHFCALFIINFFHNHNYPVTYDLNTKKFLIKSLLSCEVSTIFLMLMKIIPKDNKVNYLLRILFLITFITYRFYNYILNIILSSEINLFILNVSKNNFHLVEVYLGIYGLFFINIYWGYLIIKKMLKVNK